MPSHRVGRPNATVSTAAVANSALHMVVVSGRAGAYVARRTRGLSKREIMRACYVAHRVSPPHLLLDKREHPGIAVHLARLRQAMPGRRRAPLHRISRGLLRQCDVRELLRDPRMRAARAPEVPVSCRSTDGRLRVHRGLVQSTTAPLRHRISVTRQLRKEPATPRSPKSITVHETGATPSLRNAGGSRSSPTPSARGSCSSSSSAP